MHMQEALALTRLVDIEARTKASLCAAVAAGDCVKAAHFRRRLSNINLTIEDRTIGIVRKA